MQNVTHIDLFSGIGGFAYAARQVWGGAYENVLFCDNNKFCQEVIKKNFGKDSVIYGDIRDVTYANWIRLQKPGAQQQTSRDRQFSETTLLTGGFPCQPFSCAGKRRGTDDNRYLWPEMFRVIREFKPLWVIAENVRGLLTISEGLVFEQVCLDLERENYEVQAFIIPAVAVNAPHRRDRVWIVAHSTGERPNPGEYNRQERPILSDEGITSQDKQERHGRGCGFGEIDSDVAGVGNISGRTESQEQPCGEAWVKVGEYRYFESREWKRPWLEVATKICRVDDGLPVELDGFKLTKAGHRVERLKALGNAIVPQVAIEIMKAIKASG